MVENDRLYTCDTIERNRLKVTWPINIVDHVQFNNETGSNFLTNDGMGPKN